jgi:hypothetical protein
MIRSINNPWSKSMDYQERCALINATETYRNPVSRHGDEDTRVIEIGNGALVEVTAQMDCDGEIDATKPVTVKYKGVQVNDLMHDDFWATINTEWSKSE